MQGLHPLQSNFRTVLDADRHLIQGFILITFRTEIGFLHHLAKAADFFDRPLRYQIIGHRWIPPPALVPRYSSQDCMLVRGCRWLTALSDERLWRRLRRVRGKYC